VNDRDGRQALQRPYNFSFSMIEPDQ
jgi:hypothetical protein